MGKNKDLDIDKLEPTDAEIRRMLKEENVKTEEEFKNKILEEWDELPCRSCYQTVKLTEAVFINDYPYHKWCARELE